MPTPVVASCAVRLPRQETREVTRERRVPVTKTAYRTVTTYETRSKTITRPVRVCNPCSGESEIRNLDFPCTEKVAVNKQVPYNYTEYKTEKYNETVSCMTCNNMSMRGWRIRGRDVLFVPSEVMQRVRAAYTATNGKGCDLYRESRDRMVFQRQVVSDKWVEKRVPGKTTRDACGNEVQQQVVIVRTRPTRTESIALDYTTIQVGSVRIADAQVLVDKGLLSSTALSMERTRLNPRRRATVRGSYNDTRDLAYAYRRY